MFPKFAARMDYLIKLQLLLKSRGTLPEGRCLLSIATSSRKQGCLFQPGSRGSTSTFSRCQSEVMVENLIILSFDPFMCVYVRLCAGEKPFSPCDARETPEHINEHPISIFVLSGHENMRMVVVICGVPCFSSCICWFVGLEPNFESRQRLSAAAPCETPSCLSGVLQVDGFHCVILSLYTDPSRFWTPPRKELAHSLSVANGFLMESPQVVYLLVEVNREWCEQDTHLHRSPSPSLVISQQECCLHIPVSILIPLLHVETPVVPRLWFDLFNFLSCERITVTMLSFHADLIHYSGLHVFVPQVSFDLGGILWTPSHQNDVIGKSDSCVSAIGSEGNDQCKLIWRIDPLPLKVRKDVRTWAYKYKHGVDLPGRIVTDPGSSKANSLQTQAKLEHCFPECIQSCAVA